MEPGVIRMFSSSPPPMDDAPDEDEDEFGDFGTFSAVGGVPASVSFSELETPTTFNQTRALNATSPPDPTRPRGPAVDAEACRANGHPGRSERTPKDGPNGERTAETLTNGFPRGEQHDFADFSAFSAETNAETLDDTQSTEFEEHDAVTQELSPSNRTDMGFANFAVFSTDSEGTLRRDDVPESDHCIPNRTEPTFTDFSAFPEDCTLENDFTGSEAVSKDQDVAFYSKKDQTHEDCSSLNGNALDASGSVCSSDPASESDGGVESGGPAAMVNGAAEKDGSETETETSLGRPLSTDALEEFGDASTTGSVPSPPPLQEEETATPTGDEGEEFGEFGDGLSTHGSDDLEQNQAPKAQDHHDDDEDYNLPKFSERFVHSNSSATPEPEHAHEADDQSEAEFPQSQSFGNFSGAETTGELNGETRAPNAHDEDEDAFDEFGEFNEPTFKTDVESEHGFSASDSFGCFGSAAAGGGGAEEEEEEEEGGWSAFGNEDANNNDDDGGGEAWAAFGSEGTEEPSARAEPSAAAVNTASLSERLQQLFSSSFPQIEAPSVDDEAPTLRLLLEPETRAQDGSLCVRVWAQLEDIHEALGLRFQWGGSCCNKALLGSLGIDTRNILFTGQKKQPVIVPMYAAGLGMLEPVKPVSAAEMIASIAQNSPCSTEPVQEALPPVQFDWSSSGLTNPLDASGGSSLLNLDFFGPVEDSEGGAGSIPAGVDPELFELTTAKLDSNKMSDAFARLMSTVQATSTARRPRREENLSEEALKVISRFPDLSFMTAKVLMFPATLTPHRAPGAGSEAESGPGPGPGPGPGLENGAD